MLRSQRVLEMAMEKPAWTKLKGRIADRDRAMEDFMKNIAVSHEGEIIRVQALDPDPYAAVIEVETVIAAYKEIYAEQDAVKDDQVIDLLNVRVRKLTGDLTNKRQQIYDMAQGYGYGTDDLRSLYNMKLQQINEMDKQIQGLQSDLADATARVAATTRPAAN